jgi:hypothetical protein
LERENNGVWIMAQGNHTEEKRPPELPRGVNPQRDGPYMSLENNAACQVPYDHGPIERMQSGE